MKESSNEGGFELLASVLNGLSAASRTTQLKLFHGLVPVLATMREVSKSLGTLATPGWIRDKRFTAGCMLVQSLQGQLGDCLHAIETLAAELGYPLDGALTAYEASGANLGTLAAMEAALAELGDPNWDAWAARLAEDPGDAAA